MNLIIDVGNTFIKLAVFKDGRLLEKWQCTEEGFQAQVKEVLGAYPKINDAMVSSVGAFPEVHLRFLKNHFKTYELSHRTTLPFINKYSTPKTLGVDRIALVSAAVSQFPGKNVLIIDAGSCITYDVLNDQKEYLGGAISPGVSMRFRALHTFTERLPLLEASTTKKLIGDSTQNSITIGVVRGVVNEIQGFIELYQQEFSDLTTILTGGDAHFLLDSIKNDIFANSNFLLEGLNHILEINKDTF